MKINVECIESMYRKTEFLLIVKFEINLEFRNLYMNPIKVEMKNRRSKVLACSTESNPDLLKI